MVLRVFVEDRQQCEYPEQGVLHLRHGRVHQTVLQVRQTDAAKRKPNIRTNDKDDIFSS